MKFHINSKDIEDQFIQRIRCIKATNTRETSKKSKICRRVIDLLLAFFAESLSFAALRVYGRNYLKLSSYSSPSMSSSLHKMK